MRLSKFPLNTLKETPADAVVVSHQLMLRAGLIRRLASGLYSWLPLGLRVLRNIEQIVREEMQNAVCTFRPGSQLKTIELQQLLPRVQYRIMVDQQYL